MYGCRHTKAQAYKKAQAQGARAQRHKSRTHTGSRQCGKCTSGGTSGFALYTRHVPERSKLTTHSNQTLHILPHSPPVTVAAQAITTYHICCLFQNCTPQCTHLATNPDTKLCVQPWQSGCTRPQWRTKPVLQHTHPLLQGSWGHDVKKTGRSAAAAHTDADACATLAVRCARLHTRPTH